MRTLLNRLRRSAFSLLQSEIPNPEFKFASRRRPQLERLEDRSLMALVSYWSGDNTAVDPISGNNGTLQNGTAYTAGQVSQAFKFDGVNDRILVADSPSLALTHSLTIEGWIKVNAIPADAHGEILFRGDSRPGLDPYSLAIEPGGALNFQISSETSGGAAVQASAPLGQFTHVAATLDDATGLMSLYENGVLVAHATTTVRPFGALDPTQQPALGIGNANSTYNARFSGLIDELKLYDNALTAEDILAHFNAQRGSLMPALAINDASITEGDQSLKYEGNLVNSGEGGLNSPYQAIYGPDGNLYVTSLFGSSVLRYDANTGAPLPAPGKSGAEFVSSGAGGLDVARSLAFGPDGNLYVVSQNSGAVLRFDAVTGDSLGALVPSGSGGLDQPRGLLFHSDGYLYVTSVGMGTPAPGNDSILRYDAATGAPAGISGLPGDAVFIASNSGGLDNPSQIVFQNGNFYVASTSPSTSNSVLKYSSTGSFLGAFVPTGSGGLAGPANIVFHDGYLYVASWTNSKILRYDGTTGAFVNEVVSGGGLATPLSILFEPNGSFLVTSRDSNEIRRYGQAADAVFTLSLNAPFATPVSVNFATSNGTALAGSDYVTTSGTFTFEPGQISKTVVIHTLDDVAYEGNETFTVNLSAPVGATIADGQGVGTIIDNDIPPTKFYVVNDSSPDRTYEYAAGGVAVENYTINSGNTAPRGAASTIAGDKVWFVDANKNIYVYNTSGGLLGSWSAGSLASNADVQGITVSGTDVWLVDAKGDKVYRYTGAATRLSGSQTAASSFSLNGSNTSPTDLVTDGTSIWVVNSAGTDRVFKYTVGGSLLGKWSIDPANSSPTGITIDPSNVSNIWIVDSVARKVFEYAGAASRTSGSQLAATTFALASGNMNPQGIADPPAVGGQSTAKANTPRDDALLAIVSELDGLLGGKKRK